MFGLGLYIYSGEDLPEIVDDTDYKKMLEDYIKEKGLDKKEICLAYKLNGKSTQYQFKEALEHLQNGN